MKKIAVILSALLLTGSLSLFAQELTEAQKAEIEKKIEQKLDDFQYQLSVIGKKYDNVKAEEVESTKSNAVKNCLNLFIGRGEPYTYLDAYGNQKEHDPVQMFTSSINTGRVSSQPLKKYLEKIKQKTASEIIIEQAESVKIDSRLEKLANGMYVTTATITQRYYEYVNYGEKRVLRYSDETRKGVTVYVEPVVFDVPDGGKEVVWKIMLGDIRVKETHRIKR